MSERLKTMLSLIKQSLLDPYNTKKKLTAFNLVQQAYDYSRTIKPNKPLAQVNHSEQENNKLQAFFDSEEHKVIWKWLHYFDIYNHHLSSFIDKNPSLLEIGVYGGGSLQMWQSYFSNGCQIVGVDIDADCQRYADDNISIMIGDQSDRQFWQEFKTQAPDLDVVIDDGGHRPIQQIVTLEECLPMIAPGGVYICEDVHGFDNYFLDYIHGLSKAINSYEEISEYKVAANSVQQHVHSIHVYPFMVVIHVNPLKVIHFEARKQGMDE